MTSFETAAGRRWGLALAALAVVLAAPPSRRADAAGPPVAKAPDSTRDMQVAVRTRRALSEDPRLAPLNLGVRVRAGVVMLWGPVPSADLKKRAVQKLEGVRGVLQVRTEELYLAVTPNRVEPLRLPLAPEPPTHSQSASPDPVSGTLGTLTGRAPLPASPPVAHAPGSPAPNRSPPRRSVSLLPPEGIATPPRQPTTAPDSLAVRVERLRQAEPRFRAVRAEVRGGTVLLQAGDGEAENVMRFARQLSQVPGVERVVVASDR